MNAYIYQADVWCADCAAEIVEQLTAAGKQDTGNSEGWPQGPYADGGGEADSPQHCCACGVFLGNPLTGDGIAYVQDAFADFLNEGIGRADVLAEWAAYYGVNLWAAGAGLYGCMYQDGPWFTPDYETAVAGLAESYDLTEDETDELREAGYLELDMAKHGNEYCEITEKTDLD
jgi:hypothetical protein